MPGKRKEGSLSITKRRIRPALEKMASNARACADYLDEASVLVKSGDYADAAIVIVEAERELDAVSATLMHNITIALEEII